ncbi:hypothetical protein C9374_001287 [Naegleria lovaniensis]|uniref:Uncharacterized protein n=1 Tax=Naegleria lovaniensis TaxID=51637 RepID=A0AA88GWL6_NAELO|nr:uncharacterized protein C9374_001287 [Naegleria lovaniensis]KAG2387693.1 hypothetical protein C9374_001287 [Naegleria lovaniensis]
MTTFSTTYPRFLKASHYPPSNQSEVADKHPSKKLELEFIHGCSKKGCKGTYFHVNDEHQLVYPAAGCGVVFDVPTNTQKIFRKHDDDVVCIAKHHNQRLFARGQIGKDDMIYIWDSHQPQAGPIASIPTHIHFKNGGVMAIVFSNSGDFIACIGGNDTNSQILIYDWKKVKSKCKMFEYRVTLKIFNTADLSSRSGVFGSKGTLQNTYGVVFVGPNESVRTDDDARSSNSSSTSTTSSLDALVGVEDGSLYLFRDGKVIQSFMKAHEGAIYCMTRCQLPLNAQKGSGIVSSGKDGVIKWWRYHPQTTQLVLECSLQVGGCVKAIVATCRPWSTTTTTFLTDTKDTTTTSPSTTSYRRQER